MQTLAEADGTRLPHAERESPRRPTSRGSRKPAPTNEKQRDLLNACHCGLHSLSQEIKADGGTGTKTVQLAYLEVTSGAGSTGRTFNSHHRDFCTRNFDEPDPTLYCDCRLYGLCDAAQTVTVVWSHTTDRPTGWNTTELITTRHGLMECPTSTRWSCR